ncbi:probable F420-dependent oxidoreductase, MSMEG_2256 family [Sphingomonas laterariae]|uniref:Probable F420-dependent oxidoreductase, MSMEG_2256 family n=1 Tax=Edaphosphingomonas laterariae TaxID=861865 RepID=A0A239G910_9SPHN|nr:TIGR03617 family F420-dependent LLM class oxidoreductase [Sphingomonas laterariae]SNS65581.1 probable F420-dependent oxidoreductase, MSMEG_2256 family [Sphingomonas laterariae]
MARLKVDGAIFKGGDNLYSGDLADIAGRAALMEEMGFDGLFTLDTTVDPFMALLLAAEHSRRCELITGVAIAFARSPMTLALQAWNLQRYSRGRMILGLGSQVQAHIEKRFSMPWGPPAAKMREAILAIRAIWDCWGRGVPLDFRGIYYRHSLMTPTFNPGPNDLPDPKIYLGALGPKMVEVAGEVADGLYGHPFTTIAFMRDVQLPSLEIGLARSGRTLADFDMPAMIMTITGEDDRAIAAADRAVRKLIAFYGSTPAYYGVLEHHGWHDLGPRLNRMSKEGRWDEMTGLITGEIVDAFAVRGAPSEIAGRIAARCAGLVDRVTLYTPYALSDAVLPEIVAGLKALPGKSVA